MVDTDEHPRETSVEKLASLPTPFRDNGSVTAGNASGVNDGACALLLANADAIKQYTLKPRARVVAMATVGVNRASWGSAPPRRPEKCLKRPDWNWRTWTSSN